MATGPRPGVSASSSQARVSVASDAALAVVLRGGVRSGYGLATKSSTLAGRREVMISAYDIFSNTRNTSAKP
jgi:hypothetical protein